MDPMFSFPFKPYPIQEKFMQKLYFTIEHSELGIFESPTGTGKSLSICCGALQWLKDNHLKLITKLEEDIANLRQEISNKIDTDDWLQEEYEKIKKNQTLLELQNKLNRIQQQKEKINEMKTRVFKLKSNSTDKTMEHYFYKGHIGKKEESENKENALEEACDADLLLDEYDGNVDKDNESDVEETDQSEEEMTKIFIGSRTHSQLSQFVGEIKRTAFKDDTRVVTLGSRQHYCINPDVVKLKNVNLINERCLDLQKSKTKSTAVDEDGKVLKKTKTKSCSGCLYFNQGNITKLKERILVDIMDMEEIVKCGKELKACPYYATRAAMNEAEVVLMSHAGVASSGARSGVALNLKNNVLVLDEAHGLPAALENANSAPLSEKSLSCVKTCLQYYLNKYGSRLNSKNLLALNQIKFVVGRLLGLLIQNKGNNTKEEKMIFTLEDFVVMAEIDHINFRPLIEFCKKTRLPPKLHSFSMMYNQELLEKELQNGDNEKNSFEKFMESIKKKKEQESNAKINISKTERLKTKSEGKDGKVNMEYKLTGLKIKQESLNKNEVQNPIEISAGSSLYQVMEFLELLCDRSENGRVLVQKGQNQNGVLKYLLLNPTEHFADVIKQCRSVILAGGTMEPVSEFLHLLTGNSTDTERVNIVKCEHVVPRENILTLCVSKGPSQMSLNFSYENRMSSKLLEEVGHILRNISAIVPGGVVCFLPSYTYEETVYETMKKNGVLETISKKKVVFREPKSAGDVDQVLSKYASAVTNKEGDFTGALLLSVVGGKLSEGLNFSDDLGRCVIVVGMPYPNIKSPELKEKMNYLDRTLGNNAGHAYYESLCLKAVNQCIGRAVRHINDYACVLLLDERYSRLQTIAALPSFVQRSLLSNCTFGSTISNIAKFFTKHRQRLSEKTSAND